MHSIYNLPKKLIFRAVEYKISGMRAKPRHSERAFPYRALARRERAHEVDPFTYTINFAYVGLAFVAQLSFKGLTS
jgi:hypothetical protein